jgi:tryptophan-rich sensory protein
MGFDWTVLIFLLLMAVAGSSGALFRPGPWYETLRKPGWTPPNWVFAPVWSALYLMIAIAGWLAWRGDPGGAAVWFWGLQLVLNAVWSWLFFGRRRMDLALVDAVALWFSVAGFIAAASEVSPTAALLFLPYLAWVTVAAALNASVMRLNPAAGRGR